MKHRGYYGEFGGCYVPEVLVATIEQLVEAYENYRHNNVLPASYEIVNGHAWATSDAHSIPVESIERR